MLCKKRIGNDVDVLYTRPLILPSFHHPSSVSTSGRLCKEVS